MDFFRVADAPSLATGLALVIVSGFHSVQPVLTITLMLRRPG